MVFNRATITFDFRRAPGSENKIHRWTFHARNLTSLLNHCQPSHFSFSLQFQNFSLPNNRCNARFCAHPRSSIGEMNRTLLVQTGFVNLANFKRRESFCFFCLLRPSEEKRFEKNQSCLPPTEKVLSNEEIE